MWKIRIKLETIASNTRKTILDHEAGIEVRRDVIRKRIEDFRGNLKGNFVRSLDKAFVGIVGNMEKAMDRIAGFLSRSFKVEYVVDKENNTVTREWVQ